MSITNVLQTLSGRAFVIMSIGFVAGAPLVACSYTPQSESYDHTGSSQEAGIDLNPESADICTTELDGSQCCNTSGGDSFCTGGPFSIACGFLSEACLGDYREVGQQGGFCNGDAPCKTE